MLLVAFSVALGTLFGDKIAFGTPIAIVGFVMMNVSGVILWLVVSFFSVFAC
jgi:hypothetical protein